MDPVRSNEKARNAIKMFLKLKEVVDSECEKMRRNIDEKMSLMVESYIERPEPGSIVARVCGERKGELGVVRAQGCEYMIDYMDNAGIKPMPTDFVNYDIYQDASDCPSKFEDKICDELVADVMSGKYDEE